jgi:hypothetical protein
VAQATCEVFSKVTGANTKVLHELINVDQCHSLFKHLRQFKAMAREVHPVVGTP